MEIQSSPCAVLSRSSWKAPSFAGCPAVQNVFAEADSAGNSCADVRTCSETIEFALVFGKTA
eukprot:280574-Pyramimonas_sp.AAC.1